MRYLSFRLYWFLLYIYISPLSTLNGKMFKCQASFKKKKISKDIKAFAEDFVHGIFDGYLLHCCAARNWKRIVPFGNFEYFAFRSRTNIFINPDDSPMKRSPPSLPRERSANIAFNAFFD